MHKNSLSTARTRGDGMENVDTQPPIDSKISSSMIGESGTATASTSKSSIPGAHSIYRSAEDDSSSVKLPAKVPQGKLFYLVPHLIHSKKPIALRNKEPKFVPFEPYKAAVSPLVLPKHSHKTRTNRKNNLDLNVLVSHVSTVSTNEMNASLDGVLDELKAKQKATSDKQLAEMKKERDYYEGQLKFQVQVNSELKNLLVAAVGEDLQTRVNVLTEDKLQLARALLNSAHNLSTHTEQIEYLAGQSEVWRSKFLASSLMVEELARWKASLLQKNKLLQESNKQMLETMSQLRHMQVDVLENLKFLAQMKKLNLPSGNLLDVTAECLNISENLVLHSGIGMPDNLDLNGLDTTTSAEKLAVDALQYSTQSLMSTDEAFRAIVGQAFPMTRVAVETQTSIDNE